MNGIGVKGVGQGTVLEALEVGRKSKQPGEPGPGARRQKAGRLASSSRKPICFLQVFDPVSTFDTGEYTCQAQNGYGTPVRSDAVRMEAGERRGQGLGLRPGVGTVALALAGLPVL